MAEKLLINLATGLEDPERVTVAFLIGRGGVRSGRQVAMFLTKEAVRLALPGHALGTACEGCPPLADLFDEYVSGGGELLACPICWNARRLADAELVPNARVAGAGPLFEWMGDGPTAVFSY